MDARLVTNEWGSFIMRRREYELSARHGIYRLGELQSRVKELSCFHQGSYVRQEELLFFDTETTGLGIGAGNVPFMVGIGFYTAEHFIVEQLFIRNPGEELAMLSYLQNKLNAYKHIVSYNGRSFDWPILKNRYVLNRLQFDDSDLLHIDFLYPSRSLWRNTLPSCRLGKVEEERLGFKRIDDVPGSMAPALYFLYLSEKDARVLEGVFLHNEHDIVTLAALATHFSLVLGGEISFGELEDEELLRTGLWLERMGRMILAEKALNTFWIRLTSGGSLNGHNGEIMLQLADIYKKKSDYSRAVMLWERHIEQHKVGLALHLEPYIELAIYYEHREKNLDKALYFAEEAWTRLWRRRSLNRHESKQQEIEKALQKRIDRLKKKKTATNSTSYVIQQTERRARTQKPPFARESLL